jgi:hypothetical protein
MNPRAAVALASCLVSISAGAAPQPSPPASPAAREVVIERLQWSKAVDGPEPITAFDVRNDFGDIRARAAGDRALDVSMVVQRLDSAGEKVGFTVERRGGTVALVVSYPTGRIRDSVAQPAKDSYDRLDLVVFVPPGVTLHAQTLRGQVEARGLKSDVDAVTEAGPIFLRTTGAIQARSGSGDISALPNALALGTSGPPLILQSVSGTIAVTLLGQPGPELRAETAGEIVTSLPVRRSRHGDRTRVVSAADRNAVRLLLISSRTGQIRIVRDDL